VWKDINLEKHKHCKNGNGPCAYGYNKIYPFPYALRIMTHFLPPWWDNNLRRNGNLDVIILCATPGMSTIKYPNMHRYSS
jgi:hypothetical protein